MQSKLLRLYPSKSYHLNIASECHKHYCQKHTCRNKTHSHSINECSSKPRPLACVVMFRGHTLGKVVIRLLTTLKARCKHNLSAQFNKSRQQLATEIYLFVIIFLYTETKDIYSCPIIANVMIVKVKLSIYRW